MTSKQTSRLIYSKAIEEMHTNTKISEWDAAPTENAAQVEVAKFNGHEMVATGSDADGFSLHFLGYVERTYPNIEAAKAAAPKFAFAVLAQVRAAQRAANR